MIALNSVCAMLARTALFAAAASLCVLVLVLTWQVFGRYVMNESPGWTEPVALTLMGIAALFGAAVAVRNETHFSFPTLVESLPAPVRGALKSFARLIAIGFGCTLSFYGWLLMADSWSVPMAGAPLPEGIMFVGVFAGGALIALFALERLLAGDPATKDA